MKSSHLRQICLFSLIILFDSFALAQGPSGILRGRITSAKGTPITHANVLVKELSRGDVSSESGSFLIEEVPPGTYTVVITSLGYDAVTRTVEIRPGETFSLDVMLTEKPIRIPEVVVTATRSEKLLTNVPIPTSVLSEKQIQAQSAVRLNDLLLEQQGMFINFNQWGTGIQVEGLDPAYTLILVDGQPVVGRTAGTLELTRLSVGNIQRVEVVKGPSSSLYGSDALAAVINLITKQPTDSLNGSLKSRYGSFNTLDVSGHLEIRKGNLGALLFVERNTSDGYDLTPETGSRTMPRYTTHTLNPKLIYDFSEQTKASVSARFVSQTLSNIATVLVSGSNVDFDDRSTLLDWSVAPSISHWFSPSSKLHGKLYHARYKTKSELSHQANGSIFDQSTFDQTYNKAEGQLDLTLSKTMLTTFGGGYVYETVLADRISGDKRSATSYFLFGQQEWIPKTYLDLIASFRYDAHADFAARFSPRGSALLKMFDWLNARASVGLGFKAPTFQQLYLDFTNPQVGYSVFGSATVKEAFERLQQTGQIEAVLVDPSLLEKIRPENSLAYHTGMELSPTGRVTLRVNAFRNDLKDMIEAAPIAAKTNGQALYTYFNIHRVFTQGLDAEIVIRLSSALSVSATYQYLEAKDQDVLENVRAEKVFKIGGSGRTRAVQESEYGGLFNRSAHSGTIKVAYDDNHTGLTVSLRGIFRSKYGFADNNGNSILDDDSEYAPGYSLWNVTCSKRIFDFLILQAGVNNVFDVTSKEFAPSVPGRILYAGIATSFR